MKRAVVLLLAMVAVAASAALWKPDAIRVVEAQGIGLEVGFPSASLELVTASGRHAFTVEVARTQQQRAQGLMFRRGLAEDRGMLFLYPEPPRIISMWMKNTLIPLDMIFLDERGTVVSIHERAVPHSLRPISSGVVARAVLEVPGGTVDRLKVEKGDRVVSSALGAG